MCIVILSVRQAPGYDIQVAANREESPKRPASKPTLYSVQNKIVPEQTRTVMIAGEDRGRDGESDKVGTWLGINDFGLFVAVTNRDDGKLHADQQTKSRGVLCLETLGMPSYFDALNFAGYNLAQGGFGGCNVIFTDGWEAGVFYAPSEEVCFSKLSSRRGPLGFRPGCYAITNLDVNDSNDERIKFALKTIDPSNFVESAKLICSHEKILVQEEVSETVSSSILQWGASGKRFLHCFGKPDIGRYEDHSRHFKEFPDYSKD